MYIKDGEKNTTKIFRVLTYGVKNSIKTGFYEQ